jgi:DnaJ-class molecular chaperone
MKQMCPACKGRRTTGNGRTCQACQGTGEIETRPKPTTAPKETSPKAPRS